MVLAGIECSPKISDFRANGIPVQERVDFFDTLKLYVPYSLIHCKTIRTGIHKGNPLVPFVESGYAVLLKTLFAKLSARTGRFGNPCGWVSDGSFPYFCPYRNRVPARHERKRILLF